MTIASQIQDYADGLEDAYDAVSDMSGTIPQDRNMDNLDTAIRTIPQTPGGAAVTFFYFDETTHDLYKESTYTTVATITDVLTAYNAGLVVIKDGELNTDIGNEGLTVTAADSRSVFCLLTTTGGNQTYDVKYEYDSSQTPKWVRWERTLQRELTAGTGISISAQNVISATGATPINHLFYVKFSSPGAIGDNSITVYTDIQCTTTATYAELYDAIHDGGASLRDVYSYGGPSDVQESDTYFVGMGEYTDNTDEGYNVIEVFDYGGYSSSGNYTPTIYTYLADDQDTTGYPELPAVFSLIGTKELAITSDLPSDFTGATSSVAGLHGLVPAPTTSDVDKYLKGDGTWATPAGGSVMVYAQYSSGDYVLYKDSGHTTAFNIEDIYAEAIAGKPVVFYISGGHGYSAYVTANTLDTATRRAVSGGYNFDFVFHGAEERNGDEKTVWKLYSGLVVNGAINSVHLNKLDLQPQLSAGMGITIDYTYPNNPVITASGATTTFYYDDVTEDLYKDSYYFDQATFSDVTTAYSNGPVVIRDMTYETSYSNDGLTVISVDNIQSVFCLMQDKVVIYSYTPGGTPTWAHSLYSVQHELTAGSNISLVGNTISATDTTYSNFTGATSSVAGAAGLVPAPAAGDQEKVLHGDGTWKDTTAKLVEMSYGESNAWAKFIAAYNAGSIVYCRASSNANPGTGSQTRKAFMAYVNDAANPTSVEFQYVRSVSSKTSSQPVDQVFVYTLKNTSGGTWSVATRDMGPKLAAGTGADVSYSSGTYTVSAEPDYSTSEVDTKVKWIDGKTIYRKTINYGTLPDTTTQFVNHNISSLGNVIKIEGFMTEGTVWRTLPYADGAFSSVYVTTTQVGIYTTADMTAWSAYVTLYYTKSS